MTDTTDPVEAVAKAREDEARSLYSWRARMALLAERDQLRAELARVRAEAVTYRAGELKLLSCPIPCCVTDERDGLNAAIADVLALHSESDGRCTECVEWCDCDPKGDDCTHGNVAWPCKTVAALNPKSAPKERP